MMKHLFCALITLTLGYHLSGQHVGIGTTQPAELLHIKDGIVRHEGENQYFDFYTGSNTGLRFHGNNQFRGTWFFNASANQLNLTRSIHDMGLLFDLTLNKAFLGRNYAITPTETFGISTRVNSSIFGGMYVETTGHSESKPFYGYAIDSVARAYHYFDGGDNRWKLSVAGNNRVTVESTGQVGIGITDPEDRLHVNNSLRIDGSNPVLRFYHGTANAAYIQHNTPSLIIQNVQNGPLLLGTNNTTHMLFTAAGDVGIGTTDPQNKLHVTGAIRIDNPGTAQLRFHQGTTFAGFIQSSGEEFTISNKLTGLLTLRTNDLARLSIANNGNVTIGTSALFVNPVANRVGVGELTPDDRLHVTGGSIRIENTTAQLNFYQDATFGAFIQSGPQNLLISNKNPGELQLRTNDLRRLAITNSGDVVIGTIAPATGYRLSVDGKVIAEEIKVQMSTLWPDYVFDEQYPLMSIRDVRHFINRNHHLPGIPSAVEVTSQQGIELGEMNRLLLEKIEELTLYIIDLQEQIDALRSE